MPRALLVVLLLAGCSLEPSRPVPQKDGSPCDGGDWCHSNHCSGGFCAGNDCGCGSLMSCGTEPKTSSDCNPGWKCVGTPISLLVTGVCSLPCTSGCPSTWVCKGDFCAYIPPEPTPPTVSIDTAPDEIEVGALATFKGSATSANGAIASFTWELGDGQMASGFEVTHTYTQAAELTVQATATDDAGISGTASHGLRVCLPLGSDCYPFDQRGACCTGKQCRAAPDAGTRCQDP